MYYFGNSTFIIRFTHWLHHSMWAHDLDLRQYQRGKKPVNVDLWELIFHGFCKRQSLGPRLLIWTTNNIAYLVNLIRFTKL
jgi:hypothetical protein